MSLSFFSLFPNFAYSNVIFPNFQTPFLKDPKAKRRFLHTLSKVLLILLCYHALFSHKSDSEIEIEEEEPELVIVTESRVKPKGKKKL